MKKFKVNIKRGLLHLSGLKADVQLLGALVNIAAALKVSASLHIVESRDLKLLLDEFEDMLKQCMNRFEIYCINKYEPITYHTRY